MVKKVKKVLVKVNDLGRRIGDSHHRATLTDDEVELIRTIHEEGKIGYRTLAKFYGVSRSTIAKICKYERRNNFVANYKVVYITEETIDIIAECLDPRNIPLN